MRIGASPVCLRCVHFDDGVDWPKGQNPPCNAFADRIPDSIYYEGGKHTKPVDGDHGIQFEKREE